MFSPPRTTPASLAGCGSKPRILREGLIAPYAKNMLRKLGLKFLFPQVEEGIEGFYRIIERSIEYKLFHSLYAHSLGRGIGFLISREREAEDAIREGINLIEAMLREIRLISISEALREINERALIKLKEDLSNITIASLKELFAIMPSLKGIEPFSRLLPLTKEYERLRVEATLTFVKESLKKCSGIRIEVEEGGAIEKAIKEHSYPAFASTAIVKRSGGYFRES